MLSLLWLVDVTADLGQLDRKNEEVQQTAPTGQSRTQSKSNSLSSVCVWLIRWPQNFKLVQDAASEIWGAKLSKRSHKYIFVN